METPVTSEALNGFLRLIGSYKGSTLPDRIREHLIQLVDNADSEELRKRAFERLVNFHEEARALEYTGEIVFKTSNGVLRREAIRKLGERQRVVPQWNNELWKQVDSFLADQFPEDRIIFMGTLAKTMHKDAIPYLKIVHMTDFDARVKRVALEGLSAMANDKDKIDVAVIAQAALDEIERKK